MGKYHPSQDAFKQVRNALESYITGEYKKNKSA